MAVPLFDLSQQHTALRSAFTQAFDDLLRSGRFILGPAVDAFERQFATYCNAHHAIGCSSGTDALLLAMMALDIGPGDEVITIPFTFFCTAGCVTRLGAKPIFIDIEPDTFNLDVRQLEAAITPRTKAIIPVHLFGQSADMSPIMEIARARKIPVIEDAAQAVGAMDAGRRVGPLGDIGCFSFYPTKNLSALGDAGAIVTNDRALAKRMIALRLHGQTGEYEHQFIGGNFRIDALQAAFLSHKLPHLDQWTAARRRLAAYYTQHLQGLPLVLPHEKLGKFHVYNQYTVRVPNGQRDAFKHHLAARGIGHRVYYPLPLHLQPCFAYLHGKVGDHPHSERAALEVVSLPIFPELSQAQQDEVITVVHDFFR